ncbi:hypothetical protein ACH4TX_45795 [Streptomyces sp. NPDC021098]|uniref:hypothetical protein n=1 Tax=unclassified Streptomyces TaxID=2593676 RepID=UPI0037B3E480
MKLKNRLAIAGATAALAVGVSQAPASANEAGVQWIVSGLSDLKCAEADGDYVYSAIENGTGFRASYNISVSTTGRCSSSVIAHLRIQYKQWDGIGWDEAPYTWTTIASSNGSGWAADSHYQVKDVHFAVCEYTSSKGNYNCNYVS